MKEILDILRINDICFNAFMIAIITIIIIIIIIISSSSSSSSSSSIVIIIIVISNIIMSIIVNYLFMTFILFIFNVDSLSLGDPHGNEYIFL